MPRVLPDGTRNEFHIQRLKDKLGNRSNASSEVEFHGAWARMVGEPGRGVPTIIEMVGHTRLDCVLGAAAGMRAAVAQATWHAAHRHAFGKRARRPAADGQRARRPGDRGRGGDRARAAPGARLRPGRRGPAEAHIKRLGTAIGKYYVCKRAPEPRLRGARGLRRRRLRRGVRACRASTARRRCARSGRARATSWRSTCCARWRASPSALDAYLGEVELAAGADARLDAFTARLRRELGDPDALETRARRARRGPRAGAAGLAAAARRARPRSPTRSAPRASAATPASTTGRCPRAPTPRRSSRATRPPA